MKAIIILAFCAIWGISTPLKAGQTYEIHVAPWGFDSADGSLNSPLRTIEAAKNLVRARNWNSQGDVSILIHQGTYVLDSTLGFSPGDGGLNGYHVTYRAYQNDIVTLSGGPLVQNWSSTYFNGVPCLSASVPGLSFRSFFVREQRAILARYPNEGNLPSSTLSALRWDTTNPSDTFITTDGAVPRGSFPTGDPGQQRAAEVVAYQFWDQARMRLRSASVVSPFTILRPNQSDWKSAIGSNPWRVRNVGPYYAQLPTPIYYQQFFLEGSGKFFDAPGEWYLDTVASRVYYIPRAGESAASLWAFAPRLATLVSIQGSKGNPVRNLAFQGLRFSYTTWNRGDGAYVGWQAGSYGYNGASTSWIPGAVTLQYASGIQFAQDAFTHLGTTGITLGLGTQNIDIGGSYLADLAGDGIAVAISAVPADLSDTPNGLNLHDNEITAVGTQYGGIAIHLERANNSRIAQNRIHDVPYTAIGVGPVTTSNVQNNNGNSQSISITGNDLFGFGQVYDDGGGIYLRGRLQGSTVSGNYVHDFSRRAAGIKPILSGIFGFYLDEDTERVSFGNNAIQIQTGQTAVHLNTCYGESPCIPSNGNQMVSGAYFYLNGFTYRANVGLYCSSASGTSQNCVNYPGTPPAGTVTPAPTIYSNTFSFANPIPASAMANVGVTSASGPLGAYSAYLASLRTPTLNQVVMAPPTGSLPTGFFFFIGPGGYLVNTAGTFCIINSWEEWIALGAPGAGWANYKSSPTAMSFGGECWLPQGYFSYRSLRYYANAGGHYCKLSGAAPVNWQTYPVIPGSMRFDGNCK